MVKYSDLRVLYLASNQMTMYRFWELVRYPYIYYALASLVQLPCHFYPMDWSASWGLPTGGCSASACPTSERHKRQ